MVVEELIEEDDKPTLMRALLLRHRHVNEHNHSAFGFVYRRKFSSYTSLQVRIYDFIDFTMQRDYSNYTRERDQIIHILLCIGFKTHSIH